jgi:hypothetical protein
MAIDVGFLAEALVFYQRVHVVADPEMFKSIIRICGYEVVLEMMDMGILTIDYTENIPIVSQDFDFGLASSEQLRYQNLVSKFLQELTGKVGKGRRVANRLSKFVRPIRSDVTLPDEAREDISDEKYVHDLARALLQHFVPSYEVPQPFVFRLHKHNLGYKLETNVDFEKANSIFRLRTDVSDASLTPPYLLSYVIETRTQLKYAAEFSTDVALSVPAHVAAGCNFSNLIARRTGSQAEVHAFEDLIFNESRGIREAINSGQRNFDDVLRLVNAGMKFKEWLKKSPQDANLVMEYCREVTRVEWADGLPPKIARWAMFAAAGTVAGFLLTPVAGAAVGVGLGAGDTFLLDKLIKGWKPNQFVNGPLKEFVRS